MNKCLFDVVPGLLTDYLVFLYYLSKEIAKEHVPLVIVIAADSFN